MQHEFYDVLTLVRSPDRWGWLGVGNDAWLDDREVKGPWDLQTDLNGESGSLQRHHRMVSQECQLLSRGVQAELHRAAGAGDASGN